MIEKKEKKKHRQEGNDTPIILNKKIISQSHFEYPQDTTPDVDLVLDGGPQYHHVVLHHRVHPSIRSVQPVRVYQKVRPVIVAMKMTSVL